MTTLTDSVPATAVPDAVVATLPQNNNSFYLGRLRVAKNKNIQVNLSATPWGLKPPAMRQQCAVFCCLCCKDATSSHIAEREHQVETLAEEIGKLHDSLQAMDQVKQ